MPSRRIAGSASAARYMAEFVARTRLDVSIKLQAAQTIAMMEGENWPGIAAFMQMQLIPGYQEALDGLPVGHRQMVRMAKDVLEQEYSFDADIALALQCADHLQNTAGGFDRMQDLRCGAGALAYHEMRLAGRAVDMRELAKKFGCSPRKLKYYADCLMEKE